MDHLNDWHAGRLLPQKKRITPRSFFYTGLIIGFIAGGLISAIAMSLWLS